VVTNQKEMRQMDETTSAVQLTEEVEHTTSCSNTYEAPVIREVDPAGVLYAVLN
jgi:hypothetical protein